MYSKYLLSVLICAFGGGACLAADTSSDQGAYIGLFGGVGSAASATLQQKGTVLINPHVSLPINASGSTDSADVGMGGAQVGYEWKRWNLGQSNWGLKPAVEIEGIYLGRHSPVGEMPVIPSALGTQYVTIPMTAGVFLANAVVAIQTPYSNKVFPYIGAGIGAAFLSIRGSDSANPSEPGINHFNSDPNASGSAFAMQIKVGVKAQTHRNISLFAEYRHLSVHSTSFTFGATDYPGAHLPTTPWDVNLGRQTYDFFVAGLQYKF